jgi:hypothetical protein
MVRLPLHLLPNEGNRVLHLGSVREAASGVSASKAVWGDSFAAARREVCGSHADRRSRRHPHDRLPQPAALTSTRNSSSAAPASVETRVGSVYSGSPRGRRDISAVIDEDRLNDPTASDIRVASRPQKNAP